MGETLVKDEAEARQNRIECHRQVGGFFGSVDDLKWLYFDLTLQGIFEDLSTERELEDFVREPIWEFLWGKNRQDNLVKQAARYIDRPIFHCTALRDFFIIRLIEALATHIRDPIKDRLVAAIRMAMAVLLLLLALILYAIANWWAAAAVLILLVFKAWGWFKEINNMPRCKIRNHYTRERINEIAAAVKRGGFDEPTVIRQLELLDVKNPPMPRLIYIYGSPYFLGSDPTGVQEHTIPIPDVLYALLRLPRRNVQNEISAICFSLNEGRRGELEHRWRKFVDPMLTYDEPHPRPNIGAEKC
jgi:hypothetical protein